MHVEQQLQTTSEQRHRHSCSWVLADDRSPRDASSISHEELVRHVIVFSHWPGLDLVTNSPACTD